jgi:amidohydrolase
MFVSRPVLAALMLACFTRSACASVDDAVAAVSGDVIAWRHHLHQHPELSNREFKTAEMVADHLRQLGFDEVHTGVAHTGVVGVLRGSKPGGSVALRADMDGLPVREMTGLPFASTATGEYLGESVPVMHACGHDAHVAMLMGAATVLASMRDDIQGSIAFVFQPAEEGPPPREDGGARLMLEEGLLAMAGDPTAIFGLHV